MWNTLSFIFGEVISRRTRVNKFEIITKNRDNRINGSQILSKIQIPEQFYNKCLKQKWSMKTVKRTEGWVGKKQLNLQNKYSESVFMAPRVRLNFMLKYT
jgi:hypothetical protein